MGKFIYSLLYNISYLGIDLALCLAVAIIMLRSKETKKLVIS
jgi:thiamine transporter ThiT